MVILAVPKWKKTIWTNQPSKLPTFDMLEINFFSVDKTFKWYGCFQKKRGTPKSWILIGFPFWGITTFGNTQLDHQFGGPCWFLGSYPRKTWFFLDLITVFPFDVITLAADGGMDEFKSDLGSRRLNCSMVKSGPGPLRYQCYFHSKTGEKRGDYIVWTRVLDFWIINRKRAVEGKNNGKDSRWIFGMMLLHALDCLQFFDYEE